jgi:hypothetical protein
VVLLTSFRKAPGTCGKCEAIEPLLCIADDIFMNPVIREYAKNAITMIKRLRAKGETGCFHFLMKEKQEEIQKAA